VVLAWFLLKERLSRTQWVGIVSAFIAIALFAL
jgi:EamA domain-containing membrane protein RarD